MCKVLICNTRRGTLSLSFQQSSSSCTCCCCGWSSCLTCMHSTSELLLLLWLIMPIASAATAPAAAAALEKSCQARAGACNVEHIAAAVSVVDNYCCHCCCCTCSIVLLFLSWLLLLPLLFCVDSKDDLIVLGSSTKLCMCWAIFFPHQRCQWHARFAPVNGLLWCQFGRWLLLLLICEWSRLNIGPICLP